MSDRERAARLLNLIDEDKMIFIVRILESLIGFAEIPNDLTVAAIREGGYLAHPVPRDYNIFRFKFFRGGEVV